MKLNFVVYSLIFIHIFLNSSDIVVTNYSKYGGGDRLGDRLYHFICARYYAYKFNCAFVLTPSENFDKFNMWFSYPHYSDIDERKVFLYRGISKEPKEIVNAKGCVIGIPFFPSMEGLFCPNSPWNTKFSIDFSDQSFKKIIENDLAILDSPTKHLLPKDKITVAVHFRDGGGFDNAIVKADHKSKFSNYSLIIEALSKIEEIFRSKALYVKIFTDHARPLEILEELQKHLNSDIFEFDYSMMNGFDTPSHFLNDFYQMQYFDCLIRPDSGFSAVVEHLGDFAIVVRQEGEYVFNSASVMVPIKTFIFNKTFVDEQKVAWLLNRVKGVDKVDGVISLRK